MVALLSLQLHKDLARSITLAQGASIKRLINEHDVIDRSGKSVRPARQAL